METINTNPDDRPENTAMRHEPASSIEEKRPDEALRIPTGRFSPQQILEFFRQLAIDETLQAQLLTTFPMDVIRQELQRRGGTVEPLLNTEQLAGVLGLQLQGLYKKLQNNELGIPYVPIGRGRGYKFDPRDVRAYIQKKKIHPIVRPASLRRKIKGG
jgi:hypothetical protein